LHLDVAVSQSFLLLCFSFSFYRRVASFPAVISHPRARAKNSRSKSSEANSFRSRVTNHLSEGARFRAQSATEGEIVAVAKTHRIAANDGCYDEGAPMERIDRIPHSIDHR